MRSLAGLFATPILLATARERAHPNRSDTASTGDIRNG